MSRASGLEKTVGMTLLYIVTEEREGHWGVRVFAVRTAGHVVAANDDTKTASVFFYQFVQYRTDNVPIYLLDRIDLAAKTMLMRFFIGRIDVGQHEVIMFQISQGILRFGFVVSVDVTRRPRDNVKMDARRHCNAVQEIEAANNRRFFAGLLQKRRPNRFF